MNVIFLNLLWIKSYRYVYIVYPVCKANRSFFERDTIASRPVEAIVLPLSQRKRIRYIPLIVSFDSFRLKPSREYVTNIRHDVKNNLHLCQIRSLFPRTVHVSAVASTFGVLYDRPSESWINAQGVSRSDLDDERFLIPPETQPFRILENHKLALNCREKSQRFLLPREETSCSIRDTIFLVLTVVGDT